MEANNKGRHTMDAQNIRNDRQANFALVETTERQAQVVKRNLKNIMNSDLSFAERLAAANALTESKAVNVKVW